MDNFISSLSAGFTSAWNSVSDIGSAIGSGVLACLENAFNTIIALIIGFIDGISLVLGFKISDIFNKIISFFVGAMNFVNSIINIIPTPFNIIFGSSFIFIIALFVYRVIRG